MPKCKDIRIRIWDNGGKTLDRYSIAISGMMEKDGVPYTYFLGASEDPFHPQGFGMHCSEIPTYEMRGSWKHLGKRITFFELPPDVQRFLMDEFNPEYYKEM